MRSASPVGFRRGGFIASGWADTARRGRTAAGETENAKPAQSDVLSGDNAP